MISHDRKEASKPIAGTKGLLCDVLLACRVIGADSCQFYAEEIWIWSMETITPLACMSPSKKSSGSDLLAVLLAFPPLSGGQGRHCRIAAQHLPCTGLAKCRHDLTKTVSGCTILNICKLPLLHRLQHTLGAASG